LTSPVFVPSPRGNSSISKINFRGTSQKRKNLKDRVFDKIMQEAKLMTDQIDISKTPEELATIAQLEKALNEDQKL